MDAFIDVNNIFRHVSGDAKGCPNVPIKVRKQMRDIIHGRKAEKGKKNLRRVVGMEPVEVDDDDDEEDDDVQ